MNIQIHDDPGAPQDALYIRTPVTPEEAFQAIGRLRKEARDEIDRLIRFLDKTDDYVARELEEGADDIACDEDELEPSFSGGAGYGGDELEADDVTGGDAEAEPSLGSVNPSEYGDQARWAGGGSRDLEDEHDGAEPDVDGEPSLGWTTAGCMETSDAFVTDGEIDAGSEPEMENEHGENANGSGIVDDEPSLCGVGSHVVQGFGNDHDGELEPYPYQKDNAALRARIQRDRKPGNVRLLDGSVPPGYLLTMKSNVYVVSPVPQ